MPPRRPDADVVEQHLDLLKNFGRSKVAQELSDAGDTKKLQVLWDVACDSVKLPKVDLKVVREVWHEVMLGTNADTRIHVADEMDPDYVTIGIAYKGRLHAGHSTKTTMVLKRLMQTMRRKYGSDEELLDAVAQMYLAKPATKAKRTKP